MQNFREAKQKEVKIQDIKKSQFEQLCRYMYNDN